MRLAHPNQLATLWRAEITNPLTPISTGDPVADRVVPNWGFLEGGNLCFSNSELERVLF